MSRDEGALQDFQTHGEYENHQYRWRRVVRGTYVYCPALGPTGNGSWTSEVLSAGTAALRSLARLIAAASVVLAVCLGKLDIVPVQYIQTVLQTYCHTMKD